MDINQETFLGNAKNYINSIDFTLIIDKMVKHQGWLKKDVLMVCEMYRRFLFLNAKYGKEQPLPPSEEIDEFWHNHILDTKKYQQDCQAIFGYYLDHYPYFGIDEKTNFNDLEHAFGNMQRLYFKEFGEPIYQIRTIWSKLCAFVIKKLAAKPKRVQANLQFS